MTAEGDRVDCDFVVSGVGIEPNFPEFAGGSVEVSNGVIVDECCRTGAPDVYAAGDVANHLHPLFGRVRVEHYNNGENMGRGRGAIDARLRPRRTTTSTRFWSDQYEDKLEYAGHATTWDRFVVRGSLEQRQLIGFYLLDGQLLAAVGLNRGGDPELDEDDEMAAAARLVGASARPAPDALADERVDLWSLVPGRKRDYVPFLDELSV